jgi:hypothetical protein
MTENKSKKKSVALAMVVSMVVANPLFTAGCEQRQPKIVVDEEQMEKEEEQMKSSGGGSYIFSGGGRYYSPFIFNSSAKSSTGTTGETISAAGWKTWTTNTGTSIKSGGYSGVRMSSLSS